MTTFFKLLKENNSVAKTLVALIQNMGDYDITEKDIESAMKNIRLSDLLSLNDAVEERDMGTIMDILEPFIPGMLPQTNERSSPSGVMNPGANTGNTQKQSRETVFTQPTGTTGYSSAYSDKGAIAGGRKEHNPVPGKGPQGKQSTGVPIPKDDELGTAMSVTDQFGNIVPIDNKKAAKNITTMLNRMGRG